MFPRLDYLEWIEGRPEVAMHDLATSDLRGDRDHEPEVVPDPLEDAEDPPVGATLEMQVAGEYGVDPEQVLVTPGASTANFVATAAALGEVAERNSADTETDDGTATAPRALVEKPAYEPLVETPRGLGASVDRFLRGEEYELEVERAANATTDDTGLVTVTNRHNPSGALAERETLADLAAVARDCDARLLVDEVYAPFTTDPRNGPFGGPTAAGLDGAVVTGSLTKFHGLGDLRVGWVVADSEFVARARSVAYHVPGFAGPSRALGMRALHDRDRLGDESRDLLAENADLLASFVNSRDDLEGIVPEGNTFAFFDPANATGDELAKVAWDAGVLVVPGRFFDDSERVRVSLGRPPEQAATALDALGDVLDDLR